MSDGESVASLELGQEVEDDEQQGSPKSVAWKYAWTMESSQAVSVNGAGNAASERLYNGARSQRETRERLQRMEMKRQDYKAGPHKPAINKNSASMAETRFDDVMNKTAIGRYRKDIRAIAGAKDGSGSKEKQRVQEVFNYGDMLFQEGKMSAARKEKNARACIFRRLSLLMGVFDGWERNVTARRVRRRNRLAATCVRPWHVVRFEQAAHQPALGRRVRAQAEPQSAAVSAAATNTALRIHMPIVGMPRAPATLDEMPARGRVHHHPQKY